MANIIFGHHDSQTACGKSYLATSWNALNDTNVDRSVFIICHHVDVAKATHENGISTGGTVVAIANALNHEGKFVSLKPHFLGESLDISNLDHMVIINTKGTSYESPHHEQIFFTFPNIGCTMIVNKHNWSCDGAMVIENVMGEVNDEGDGVGMTIMKKMKGMRC